MATVVLQGLFPLKVDSPLLQSRNKTLNSETENVEVEEFERFGPVRSTLVAGLVEVISSLGSTDTDRELNETDDETGEDSFYLIGWSVHGSNYYV